LVHWKSAGADQGAADLRAWGYDVEAGPVDGPEDLRDLKADPPAAVIIDLSTRPSQGRDVGLALHQPKKMRHVPLLFVDGDPEINTKVRQVLPDAMITTWKHLRKPLEQALAHPQVAAAPPGVMAGYSGTPLPKKLGIKPGSVVILLGAPAGFDQILGALPDGATLRKEPRGHFDLTLWFVTSRSQLERDMKQRATLADGRGLWIIWPKKTSKLTTDVNENMIRDVGLAAGLVDYKVCAVDTNWSGLLFTHRKKPAANRP
jgi:hypothetical protein